MTCRCFKLAAALGIFAVFCFSPAIFPEASNTVEAARPERITYERAMELENQRHVKNLKAIARFYAFHRPLRNRETRREYEYHEKRVEEIKKRYGTA